LDGLSLKIRELHLSETSETTYQSTPRHIPVDLNLQQHCCEYLKSYIVLLYQEAHLRRLLHRSVDTVTQLRIGKPRDGCPNLGRSKKFSVPFFFFFFFVVVVVFFFFFVVVFSFFFLFFFFFVVVVSFFFSSSSFFFFFFFDRYNVFV
jgi:hypothetical protein